MFKTSTLATADANAITKRLFLTVSFFVMCCGGVLGQENVANETNPNTATENVSTSQTHRLEMVKWFLGGSSVSSPEETNNEMISGKKALIDAGMKPNRILNNSFLKKALSYDCLNA